MGTFLTTPKMSPELAARVEAAVTGKPAAAKMSPKVVALLRFFGIVGFVGIIVWLFVVRRQAALALEANRNEILAQLHEQTSQVTEKDRAMLPQIEKWVAEQSKEYEGDLIDDSLRGAGMMATLSRPIMYIRGPVEGFKTVQGLADMGQTTYRDAFLLCLFDPPAKSTEKTLRDTARVVLAPNSERNKATAHVVRFHNARAGLPYFSPQWEERLRGLDNSRELNEMRKKLNGAMLEESVRAIKARLLLVVMDEPKDGKGPTEIDGANRHYVRVLLQDLDADKALLRQRKLVDPAWIPTDRRGEHSNGMNSCELGMEVRAAILGTTTPPPQTP